MRQELYRMPCPGSFEVINVEEDTFVALPNGNTAIGTGYVFVYVSMIGNTGHRFEGCVVEVSLDEVA